MVTTPSTTPTYLDKWSVYTHLSESPGALGQGLAGSQRGGFGRWRQASKRLLCRVWDALMKILGRSLVPWHREAREFSVAVPLQSTVSVHLSQRPVTPEEGCHPLSFACQWGTKRTRNKCERGLWLLWAFEPGCILILISWSHSSDSSFSFEENQRACLPFSINAHHFFSPCLSHHPRHPCSYSQEVGE